MEKKEILNKYEAIWKKYKDKFKDSKIIQDVISRGIRFQYDEIKDNETRILFVGINPSFKDKDPIKIDSTYSLKTIKDKPQAYFNAFINICNKLNDNKTNKPIVWYHMDLLVFRHTNQKFIETILLTNDDGVNFVKEQINLSRVLFSYYKPEVIIVSNALARDLIKRFIHEEDFKDEFSNELGTQELIKPNELQGVPVFYTSMLSGQRTLDKGSHERLIWHIKQVLSGA